MQANQRRCIAILGGSFDPVHLGHVALAEYFVTMLQPDVLRIIPTGNPWQKRGLQADAVHRLAMARLAFSPLATPAMPVELDEQEVRRQKATYTIDTLKALRQEVGPDTSLVFVMGADQLLHLNTWQSWRELFDHAHLCAASRPGYSLESSRIPDDVLQEFTHRQGTIDDIRQQPCGRAILATDLSVDISSTAVRALLDQGKKTRDLLPLAVDAYIMQHHLYHQ